MLTQYHLTWRLGLGLTQVSSIPVLVTGSEKQDQVGLSLALNQKHCMFAKIGGANIC